MHYALGQRLAIAWQHEKHERGVLEITGQSYCSSVGRTSWSAFRLAAGAVQSGASTLGTGRAGFQLGCGRFANVGPHRKADREVRPTAAEFPIQLFLGPCTSVFRAFTQRPCGSPVNGGRHRAKRRRPSYGLRQSCAPRRRQSCVRRHRRRSYARPRHSSAPTFAARIGTAALERNTAALEPSTAAPEPNTAAPEPGCVAHPGSVATAPRLRDLRSAAPCCERPASPIGSRTLTPSPPQTGSSFPCRPIGWN